MQTNTLIIDFLNNNYLLLGLFLIVCVPKIIPIGWNDSGQKITILQLIIQNLIVSIIIPFLSQLLASFSFQKSVTIVIFIMVAFDIFFLRQISGHIITLVAIGIIALYLERLIETGKSLKLFGLILWEKDEHWEKEKNSLLLKS